MSRRTRPATVEDIDSITGLGMHVQGIHFAEHPDLFLAPDADAIGEFMRNQLSGEHARVFVAIDNTDRVVGYALALRSDKEVNPFKPARVMLELDQLAVAAHAEGQGYGAALLEAVNQLGREIGATETRLTVWTFNERAIAFYERHGFKTEVLQMARRELQGS